MTHGWAVGFILSWKSTWRTIALGNSPASPGAQILYHQKGISKAPGSAVGLAVKRAPAAISGKLGFQMLWPQNRVISSWFSNPWAWDSSSTAINSESHSLQFQKTSSGPHSLLWFDNVLPRENVEGWIVTPQTLCDGPSLSTSVQMTPLLWYYLFRQKGQVSTSL